MDRHDLDVGPRSPSRQMALFGDLAESGNCAAQLQGISSILLSSSVWGPLAVVLDAEFAPTP
jgi:hypothetical protein